MNDNLPVNYNDNKVLETIKGTVAIGATNAEFAMFVEFCKGTGLNPFKREIWFIKANGRVQMMTGIQGFFAIANNNEQFDGSESGLIDPQGNLVEAEYPKNDFIGAWAKVYRKDRKIATKGVAMLADYDKKQSNWNTMKRVMIIKCAESVALRKAFPQQLNGLYTPDEMGTDAPAAPSVETPATAAEAQKNVAKVVEVEPGGPPTSNYVFSSGKHKGKRLDEVPLDYVIWTGEQSWCPPEIKQYLVALQNATEARPEDESQEVNYDQEPAH